MILRAADGIRGLLVNLDTGQPLRHVRWANLETGEYECLVMDAAGQPVRFADGKPLTRRGRARLHFQPAQVLPYSRKPATPLEEIRKEILKGQPESALRLPQGISECEEKGCHAQATMEVADEIEVEPHVEPDGRLYSRALCKRVRRYCPEHYRCPTITSQRGVESEVPVRPGE